MTILTAARPQFVTNVILTNRKTGDDVQITVHTETERFAELAPALRQARKAYPGYEVFEMF